MASVGITSPVEIERNGRSIVSFCNRSEENKEHGTTRVYDEEALPFEKASHSAFYEDITRIHNSREYHRLQGVYQYDLGRSHEHETRNTHTQDVEHVAEGIASALNLDRRSTYLVRAISFIHDIGHMTMGHEGERAAIKKLAPFGVTWTHDAAGLRVVTEWSNRGLSYPGLNLTLDTLEGLVKRYWRYDPTQPASHFNHHPEELPDSIRAIDEKFNLHLGKHNHVEGQIAAIADWVAFTATDIEDGLRSKTMTIKEVCDRFPQAAALRDEGVRQVRQHVKDNGGGILKSLPDTRDASVNKLFAGQIKNMLMQDVITQTRANIEREVKAGHLKTADDVRNLDDLIVGFSPEMYKGIESFGQYCEKEVFPRALTVNGPLQEMVELTIDDIVDGKMKLPASWNAQANQLRDIGDQKALTELACIYLTCVADDKEVRNNIRDNHREFWDEHVKDKQIKGRTSPAYIANATRIRTQER